MFMVSCRDEPLVSGLSWIISLLNKNEIIFISCIKIMFMVPFACGLGVSAIRISWCRNWHLRHATCEEYLHQSGSEVSSLSIIVE